MNLNHDNKVMITNKIIHWWEQCFMLIKIQWKMEDFEVQYDITYDLIDIRVGLNQYWKMCK